MSARQDADRFISIKSQAFERLRVPSEESFALIVSKLVALKGCLGVSLK